MITVKRYDASFASQWDQFVAGSKNGLFLFKRSYMDYHADRFTDHSLCFFRDDELFALLPAHAKGNEFISHGGLTFGGIISDSRMKVPHMLELFDALKGYLKEQGIASLVYKAVPHIYHVHPAEEDRYALFRHQAVRVRCDVTAAIDRSHPVAYSDRRKRGIRKAQKAGVTFECSQDYEGYFRLVGSILEAKHHSRATHTAAEMALLAGRFPDNIALWIARSSEHPLLAGVVMYAGGQVAHAQYIAASPEGQECGALDGLFDHLIMHAYAPHPWFDFGISTEQGGQVLNGGLITQKEEFGARAVVHETFQWDVG